MNEELRAAVEDLIRATMPHTLGIFSDHCHHAEQRLKLAVHAERAKRILAEEEEGSGGGNRKFLDYAALLSTIEDQKVRILPYEET